MDSPLYPNHAKVLAALKLALEKSDSVIFAAPCGYGKTFILSKLIKELDGPSAITCGNIGVTINYKQHIPDERCVITTWKKYQYNNPVILVLDEEVNKMNITGCKIIYIRTGHLEIRSL